MSIKIQIIYDIEKYKETLSAAWSNFALLSIPEGFEYERLISWWNQYGNTNNPRIGFNKQPLIIFIYNGEKIIGILPLVRVERFKKKLVKISTLEFLTQSFSGQYLDLIHANMSVEEVRIVFKLLSEQFRYDLFNLCYLNEDSILLKAGLGATCLHAGKVVIPLNTSYENIRNEVYSKNLRHVLNKFKRRIGESEENIRSEVIESKESIIKIKENIKKVSLSKLKDPGMHSLYQDPELGALYFESFINKEKPFCSVYMIGDDLLSYNMGYIRNDVVYAFDAAYNRQYAESQKIGLGILAYDKLVEKYAGKYKALDMGFGLDNYKFRFSKNITFTYSLLIAGNTFKAGLLYNHMVAKYRQMERLMKDNIKNFAHVQ